MNSIFEQLASLYNKSSMKAKSVMDNQDPVTNEEWFDCVDSGYQEMLSDARVQVRKDIMRAKAIEEVRKEIRAEAEAVAEVAKKKAEAVAKVKAEAEAKVKAEAEAEAEAEADRAAKKKLSFAEREKYCSFADKMVDVAFLAEEAYKEAVISATSWRKAVNDRSLHVFDCAVMRRVVVNLQAEATLAGVNITQKKAILTAELDAVQREVAKLQKIFEDKKRIVEDTIKSMEVAYKVRIDKVTAAQAAVDDFVLQITQIDKTIKFINDNHHSNVSAFLKTPLVSQLLPLDQQLTSSFIEESVRSRDIDVKINKIVDGRVAQEAQLHQSNNHKNGVTNAGPPEPVETLLDWGRKPEPVPTKPVWSNASSRKHPINDLLEIERQNPLYKTWEGGIDHSLLAIQYLPIDSRTFIPNVRGVKGEGSWQGICQNICPFKESVYKAWIFIKRASRDAKEVADAGGNCLKNKRLTVLRGCLRDHYHLKHSNQLLFNLPCRREMKSQSDCKSLEQARLVYSSYSKLVIQEAEDSWKSQSEWRLTLRW